MSAVIVLVSSLISNTTTLFALLLTKGVHGRNAAGKYVTIFESPVYQGECAGLAFSPDGMHLYIAYQDEGVLLDVSRKDGLPFHAKSLNIKYHQAGGNKLNNINSNNINGGNDNNGGGGGGAGSANGGDNKNNNNGGGGAGAANTVKAKAGGGTDP